MSVPQWWVNELQEFNRDVENAKRRAETLHLERVSIMKSLAQKYKLRHDAIRKRRDAEVIEIEASISGLLSRWKRSETSLADLQKEVFRLIAKRIGLVSSYNRWHRPKLEPGISAALEASESMMNQLNMIYKTMREQRILNKK